jgi:hippurate hydrolase
MRDALAIPGETMSLIDRFNQMHSEMTAWRRDIHAHPELGFQEHRTAELVATKLTEFGCEVHRGIAGTGVVGVLRAGNGSGFIGLRADMDALPIQETTTHAYRSVHGGRMHACGHDGHTSMLLGAAKYLAETRQFEGTVHFIFQPAEEGVGGAQAMVEAGLFGRFPCDSIFALHNAPGTPVGKFWLRSGTMMAGGAFFDIKVTGRGVHGAWPENSIDPVLTACQITNLLQAIVSRNVKPSSTAVVSVTGISTGDAYNVIPESATIRGTARFFTDEMCELIESGMRRTVQGVAHALGATATLDFRVPFAPLVNDPAEAMFLCDVAADLFGEESVRRDEAPIMGSEDFSFMLRERPGAYIYIGNGDAVGSCPVHNPNYDFNDAALPFGAAVLATRWKKSCDA